MSSREAMVMGWVLGCVICLVLAVELKLIVEVL